MTGDPASTKPSPRPSSSTPTQAKQQHTADAVEHSNVEFTGKELVFTTTRFYGMALKSPELERIVQQIAGRPLKIVIQQGEENSAGGIQAAAQTASEGDPGVRERALNHPEVKRFQALFPDAQVRAVRDLKQ